MRMVRSVALLWIDIVFYGMGEPLTHRYFFFRKSLIANLKIEELQKCLCVGVSTPRLFGFRIEVIRL